MWNMLLKEKYGNSLRVNLSSIQINREFSLTFSSIAGIRSDAQVANLIARENFKWVIGNGETALFWEDWWVQQGPLARIFPRLYRISSLKWFSVKDFVSSWKNNSHLNTSSWTREVFSRDHALIEDLNLIIEGIIFRETPDILAWKEGKKIFKVKDFTLLLSGNQNSREHNDGIWRKIWNSKLPPKITIFFVEIALEYYPH